MPTPVQPVF